MTEQQALERIATLRDEIAKHDTLYYEDNAPELDDALYDARLRELRELEAQFPQHVTSESPTQRVSGKAASGYRKVAHGKPMLSLYTETNFTDQGAFDFTRRVSEFLVGNKVAERTDRFYCCELKFDGLSLNLRYEFGELVLATTRGDGMVGEDVTLQAKKVPNILHRIDEKAMPVLEVRGEVMMPKSTLRLINAARETAGKKLYVNTRNAAAGAMRSLDATNGNAQHLVFYAYGLGEVSGAPVQQQSACLNWFRGLGFAISPHVRTKDPFELVAFHQDALARREALDYDIDGVVYKIDDFALQEKLGYSGREPRWAVAHKFEPEGARTQVLAIELQIGRTGKATPVAKLAPVFVGGTTISNATLSNESEIKRKDIRVGDTVAVHRAGDVIPEIISVVSRPESGSHAYVFPKTCPECGSALVKKEDEADYRCSGGAKCPAQAVQKLIHFCSRKALGIDGLGEKLIEQLAEAGVFQSPADIFSIGLRKKIQIGQFEEADVLRAIQRTQLALDTLTEQGIGLKTASNLIRAIDAARITTLPKLLYALGIRHASEGTAKRLVKAFGTMERIMSATVAELEAVDDIGPIVAKSVHEFFSDEKNRKEIEALRFLGVTWLESDIDAMVKAEPLPLTGQVFVITGSCEGVNREELKTLLESHGAEVSNAVSAKTDYVIAGNNAGTKLDKAIKLGIKTVDMQVFHPSNPTPPAFTQWGEGVTF